MHTIYLFIITTSASFSPFHSSSSYKFNGHIFRSFLFLSTSAPAAGCFIPIQYTRSCLSTKIYHKNQKWRWIDPKWLCKYVHWISTRMYYVLICCVTMYRRRYGARICMKFHLLNCCAKIYLRLPNDNLNNNNKKSLYCINWTLRQFVCCAHIKMRFHFKFDYFLVCFWCALAIFALLYWLCYVNENHFRDVFIH